MEKGDGAIDITKKPILTLVNFGNVDENIYNDINHSIENFFDSIRDELNPFPEIKIVNRPNPEIEGLGREEEAFSPKINEIPGKIVIGVTDIGIFDHFPDERFIFGYGSCGKGLLSTRRFIERSNYSNTVKKRLEKEIIKILSLAVGIRHCNHSNCILTYHRNVEDLDNERLCKSCEKSLIQDINYFMGD